MRAAAAGIATDVCYFRSNEPNDSTNKHSVPRRQKFLLVPRQTPLSMKAAHKKDAGTFAQQFPR